jgi:hypothetical protein
MAGKYLHGALVQFTETDPVPVPSVTVFQFNPESLKHGWRPAHSQGEGPTSRPYNPLAIRGSPEETFTFTLIMDAGEAIAAGGGQEVQALATGLMPRLAALEMMMFPAAPPGGGLVGTVSAALGLSASASATAKKCPVPASSVPLVFFVWGPGRILPVRVSQLDVVETLYDAYLLNPTHAEAQIELTVLTKEELALVKGKLGTVAKAASTYAERLRQSLALANLDNATESIIGMLPV